MRQIESMNRRICKTGEIGQTFWKEMTIKVEGQRIYKIFMITTFSLQ